MCSSSHYACTHHHYCCTGPFQRLPRFVPPKSAFLLQKINVLLFVGAYLLDCNMNANLLTNTSAMSREYRVRYVLNAALIVPTTIFLRRNNLQHVLLVVIP